ATSTSTTAIGLIRALTDARPIKPTSTRCLSARRPNPAEAPLIDAEILFRQPQPPQGYRSPADLKGMKIGVTAPGSSTHFMVPHGLKRDDASFVGIGASASAVAAVQRGEIDAIVNVDPVINLLESQGLIKVVADTRTLAGTREVFGGAYPAAVLYAPRAF